MVSALHRGKEVERNPKPVIGSLEIAEQYGSVALAPGTFFFSDGFSLVEQKTPLSSSPGHLMLQWGPLPTPYFIPLELCLEVHGRDLGSLCEDLCSEVPSLRLVSHWSGERLGLQSQPFSLGHEGSRGRRRAGSISTRPQDPSQTPSSHLFPSEILGGL